MDYFSRYPEIKKLTNTNSNNIIMALKEIFSRFGIPETVVSDNGPQYSSQEFVGFASAYDFCHVTSSPHFPQSKGQAERTVQTVKKLLKESPDPHMALLTYRCTPFPWCGLSPAELLMGRRLHANIPLLDEQLTPDWKYLGEFRRKNHVFKERQKRNYDRHHGTRSLSPIPDDSGVWVTSTDQPVSGTVISPADTPRSYMVETPAGLLHRNRQHLNQVPKNEESSNQETFTREPIMTRSRTGTRIQPPDRF